jgi:hypothetical protein
MKDIELSRDPEDIASFNGENVTDVVIRFLFNQTVHVDKFEVSKATGLTPKQCQGALSRIRCRPNDFKLHEIKVKGNSSNAQKLTKTLLVEITHKKRNQKDSIKKKEIDKRPLRGDSRNNEMPDAKNKLWAIALGGSLWSR